MKGKPLSRRGVLKSDDLVKNARIQLEKGGGILVSTGLKLCDRIEELQRRIAKQQARISEGGKE